MKYCELSIAEKKELKEKLWQESFYNDGYTDYDYLSDEQKNVVDACEDWNDIPEEIVESAYSVYDFTTDDFFCDVYDDCESEDNENDA